MPSSPITFKQFLTEGGAATSSLGTSRATKEDISAALDFITRHTGIARQKLEDNLLGTTAHTLAGRKKDSGDVDIALEDGMFDREDVVEKMRQATGMEKVKQTGAGTFSFAVPTTGDRKVQVDLMFVPSEKWARFGYHAAADSRHKGVVRNLLLVNVLKHTFEPGKDVSVKDNGVEVARVRRVFKMDGGLERTFKVAPLKRDGKTRGPLRKATAEEVDEVLRQVKQPAVTFSRDPDAILDPDKAAAYIFGPGTKAKDILSAEQVISLILKRPDHADILKDAARDIEAVGQPLPDDLKPYA